MQPVPSCLCSMHNESVHYRTDHSIDTVSIYIQRIQHFRIQQGHDAKYNRIAEIIYTSTIIRPDRIIHNNEHMPQSWQHVESNLSNISMNNLYSIICIAERPKSPSLLPSFPPSSYLLSTFNCGLANTLSTHSPTSLPSHTTKTCRGLHWFALVVSLSL